MIIAMIISTIIALIEMINRYSKDNFVRVICLAFYLYIGFNMALALLTYFFIPILLKESFFLASTTSRGLIAALCYSMLFRWKLFDLRIGKRTLPVGSALLFDAVRNFLFHHMSLALENRKWKDALQISSLFQHLESYVLAINTLCRSSWNMEMDERERIIYRRLRNLRNRIIIISCMDRSDDDAFDTRVVRAAMLLVDHFGSKKRIIHLLNIFI